MCIIAVKDKGVKFPEYDIMEECFFNNPDGAGYMVAGNGKVEIHKGFMTFQEFYQEIKTVPDDLPVIMHFRIGTHGGNIPQNTHPFPVKQSLKALKNTDINCKIGVAHNGIIGGVYPRSGISDTMEYIYTRLYPAFKAVPDFLNIPALRDMLEGDISSKMAFLDSTGKITLIGDFIEDNGIYYSNSTYKPFKWKRYSYFDDDYYNGKYSNYYWDSSECMYKKIDTKKKKSASKKQKNKKSKALI